MVARRPWLGTSAAPAADSTTLVLRPPGPRPRRSSIARGGGGAGPVPCSGSFSRLACEAAAPDTRPWSCRGRGGSAGKSTRQNACAL